MSESIGWIFPSAHLWPLSYAESPRDPVKHAQPVPLPALPKESAKGPAGPRRPLCQGLSCGNISTMGAWICSCCSASNTVCSSLGTSWP